MSEMTATPLADRIFLRSSLPFLKSQPFSGQLLFRVGTSKEVAAGRRLQTKYEILTVA